MSGRCSGVGGSLGPDLGFGWVGCLLSARLVGGGLVGEGLCGGGGLEDLLEFCCLGEVLLLVAAVGWLWSRVAGVHGAGLANSCLFSPTTVCLYLTGVGRARQV